MGSEGNQPRQVIGAVVRGLVRALQKRQLHGTVAGRVSADAKELLDRPPLHVSWTPAAPYEELLRACGQVLSEAEVRELGRELVYEGVGPIIRPLIKTLIGMSGGGPAGMFRTLNRSIPTVYRGVRFDFQSQTDRAGELTVAYDEPVDPILFGIWEGAFVFGRELHGAETRIDPSVISADRRSARIRISW